MKKILFTLALTLFFCSANAQSCYWVFLTDKDGTTFDPYSYFDAKAIERYQRSHADLYDISNYPLNSSYVSQIDAMATEEVGQSRWFNAVAVMATDDQIAQIERLPFVQKIDLIASEMQIAEYTESQKLSSQETTHRNTALHNQNAELTITDQLLRMQGDQFIAKGIDGTGIRIAVFDGGFHAVNTHQAFKHLRDNGRIIATWDFTKKKDNVYDNHTHGTMVLSCIAGKLGNKQMGLATGASFLLAKTEVDPEPFKEEVWWAQAVEWADKNGADIINSSLGYGRDRHYTWEMDARSYVAKAANMAARKGMLVCNSAGNEGGDSDWKCIITPGDADDILTVGGINPSLKSYNHIYFSSYGPTADGRLKPNVCNFGYCEVADPHNDQETDFAYGTSFSSPLTAGFCACAWQTMRDKGLTALQMKSLIEKSADLYPYYDYAFGYGVPQASYFLDESKRSIEPAATFDFEERGDYLLIHPKKIIKEQNKTISLNNKNLSDDEEQAKEDVVMFKIQDRTGLVERYVNLGVADLNDEMYIAIPKSAVYGYTLVAHVNGFTNSYQLSKFDSILLAKEDHSFEYYVIDTAGYFLESNYEEHENRTMADNKTSNWGIGQKYLSEVYFQYGIQWFFNNDPMKYSDAFNLGFRMMRHFKKWYALGLGLDVALNDFRYQPTVANRWDTDLLMAGKDFSNAESKIFNMTSVNLEFFQRIRFVTGGKISQKGLHWDLGIYGGLLSNNYRVWYNKNQHPGICQSETATFEGLSNVGRWTWGVTTRLTWDWIGLYARYRFSQDDIDLPQLQLGLQISL